MHTVKPQLIHSDLFRSIGITAFFTKRQGGVSHPPFNSLNFGSHLGDNEHSVSENMERLMTHAGLTSPPHQTEQEHGTHHVICSAKDYVHETAADILISSETNCPVSVRIADCLPVLLADPVNRVIAAVHAGWRGTVQQVVTRAVKVMIQQGATTKNIHVSLGPCIGRCCFEIDAACANQLSGTTSNASDAIIRKGDLLYADLTAINIMQLQEAGVSDQHIESNHTCTCCNPDHFFSYRRDHGKTGRHLAVVVLPDDI